MLLVGMSSLVEFLKMSGITMKLSNIVDDVSEANEGILRSMTEFGVKMYQSTTTGSAPLAVSCSAAQAARSGPGCTTNTCSRFRERQPGG